jgi:uncharacterized membrane protein YfcA
MTVLLDIAVCMMISALTGMGVGGGGLMVIYLTLARSISQISAQGINTVFFLCASLGAFVLNAKKRKINYKRVLVICIFGMLSAVLGALAASALSSALLRRLYGGLLMFSGAYAIIKK